MRLQGRGAEIYFNPIYKLLSDGSRMGVNEISKKIDKPVASIHKYLTKSGQTFFVQIGTDRKWTLGSLSHGVEAWPRASWEGPLDPDNDKDDAKIVSYINEPIENVTDILKLIKVFDEMADIYSRRSDFLRQLVEWEMKNKTK